MADFASQILFEDNHLLVIRKLPGQLAQGDRSGDLPVSELAKDFIKQRDGKPGNVYMGVPHRLDRPVSGILILAKTSKAMTRMSDLFRQRAIEKTYLAITDRAPSPPAGKLVGYMRKNEKANKSYVSDQEKPDHKRAELDYELVASSDRYHLLKVALHTGRHHQIRAQLAHAGCRIRGDLKYGYPRSNPDASIDLVAWEARFTHPVRKTEITVRSPLPDDRLWQYFAPMLEPTK